MSLAVGEGVRAKGEEEEGGGELMVPTWTLGQSALSRVHVLTPVQLGEPSSMTLGL